MELIFFRHGATDGNREHRYIGSTDEPLSGECRELLKKNGTRERIQGLISSGISAIYTSPMERCRETAELLFPKERYPNLLRREIPDFRECDFGEFEGKTYRWFRNEHCMVMCGFDKENGTVLIQDPLDGLVERDAETFAKYYEELGKNAMIIH